MNKYGAKKVVDPYTGEKFDSKKEHNRWLELLLLEKAGEISGLRRQVRYELLPPVYGTKEYITKTGRKIKRRVTIEGGVSYIADFVYRNKAGEEIVEDVKGVRTATYLLKRKMMLYFHGVRVREV